MCESDRKFTINSLSTIPSSVSATANPICSGQSTTLTVNGGSLGSGGAWYWYSGSCGGTFITSTTGNSISVSPTTTTTYFVTSVGTCNPSGTGCRQITITVNTPSSILGVSATPTAVCPGSPSTLQVTGTLGSGASNWNWFQEAVRRSRRHRNIYKRNTRLNY